MDELKRDKLSVEEEILDVIQEFEKRYGVCVSEVNLLHNAMSTLQGKREFRTIKVEVEIKL